MQELGNPDGLNAFVQQCKNHKLRITPQRTAIYKALIQSRDHPSTDAVYRIVKKKYPNISFDTVNRTLLTFAETGITDVVEGHGDPKRFDPNLDAHHHFYCIGCGKIIDFCHEQYDEISIPEEIEKKFTVSSKRVVLKGFCDRCKEEK